MLEIDRHSVLSELNAHIGKEKGISCADLVRSITWQAPDGASMRKVRKVIEQLRREGEHVCGHPKSGYFIAANAAELNEACLFLYERAMTTLMQISAMKRVSIPDLRGQMRLPNS